MRFDDGQAGSGHEAGSETSKMMQSGGEQLLAINDSNVVPQNEHAPITGNVLANDQLGRAGGVVEAISSNNTGSSDDRADNSGNLRVTGEFGTLLLKTDGSYRYTPNHNVQNGATDLFTYRVGDPQGHDATAQLAIRIIGDRAELAANALRVTPNADGTLVLPPGVGLDDVQVVGRDLVITLPDGTQWVIVDGAIFMPQLVIDNAQVPPTTLAALLIGQEPPAPALGPDNQPPVQSSGGNFELPVGDIGNPVPLGDLLPPTDFGFQPPPLQEPLQQIEDEDVDFIIVTPDVPAGALVASATVNEAGLPARGSEPAGSNSAANSETTTGTIQIIAGDAPFTVALNGVSVTAVGQTFTSPFGVLTITSITATTVGFSYTLTDNTAGDNTNQAFAVTVTDTDGDVAQGSLTINIVDDVPTARADTDSSDLVTHIATGNVITSANTTSGAAGADTVGADNATLTGIVSGTGSNFTAVGAGGATIAGQFGSLTINADGSYTYTANANGSGGQTDVFTYRLTDGDGDVSTATLSISNPDLIPVVGANAAVQLDDDALAGGNPGGVGDDADAVNATGTLSGSGGNGALTFAFQTSGAPAGFTYEASGSNILVKQGGVLVLTVTLNPATGAYTVTQNAPITHAAGGDENNQALTLNYSVTDSDGDSVPGTLSINVDDDTPTLVASATQPGLTVDETVLATDASASFASVFTASFGADGPAAANSITYALGLNAGASGLVDVATGTAVVLSIEGGQVVGRAGAGGAIVFTVSVSANGTVTLDQQRAVVNPNAADPNDPVSLSGDNLITLTATATDRDGDTATATANIGQNLTFLDDGPSVTASAQQPSLTVDETNLGIDASANFAAVFTPSFGADGAAAANSITYALGLNAGASGLVDVATGATVVLTLEGGQVVGRAGAGGPIVFTVSVAANGDVTLDQQRAVVNPNAADPNDPISLAGDNLITLTATVTDRDGDQATATANIGQNLTFLDDGPAVSANADVQLDDDALAGGNAGGTGDVDPDTANTTGTLGHSFGADGGSLAYLTSGAPAGFTYETSGTSLLIKQGATVVITLTLDTATGAYTVTQNAPIVHPAGSDENDVSFTVNYRVTDGDGDTADGSININVDDDTPVNNGTVSTVGAVQEDALNNANSVGNTEGVGQTTVATITSASIAALVSAGADAPVTIGLNLLASGTPGSIEGTNTGLTQNGVNITWDVEGTTLRGLVAGDPAKVVFTITPNGANFDFQLLDNIDHSPSGAGDLDLESLALTGAFVATDADGDTVVVDAGATITIENDVPIATAGTSTGTVDEDGVVEGTANAGPGDGIAGGTGDVAGAATVATGSVSALFQSGADEPLTFSLAGNAVTVLTALNLTSGGVALSYSVVGDTVTASAPAGNTIFTFQLQANGNWTFTLVDQLDHAPGNDENDLTINLGAVVVATDADGDSVTGNAAGLVITVDDDTPTNNSTSLTAILVHEDALPGGITEGVGQTLTGSFTVAQIQSLVNTGADEPVTIGFNAAIQGTNTGLTQGGVNITWDVVSATQVRGVVGGNTVFTLALSGGNYTFTLVDNIDHSPSGAGDADTETLSLASVFTATDADGDTVIIDAGASVNIENDVPTQIAPDPTQLSNIVGGTATGFLDTDNDVDNNFGADGASVIFTAATITALNGQGLTSGSQPLSYAISNGGLTLTATKPDASIVFVINLQPVGSPDQYIVTLSQPLDSVTVIDFNAGGYNFVGGNNAWNGFVPVGEDIDGPVVNSIDNNSPDLLLTPEIGGVDDGTINSTANTGGVGNTFVDSGVNGGEVFRVDFVTDLSGNNQGGGGYSNAGNRDHVFDGHYTTNGSTAAFTACTNAQVRISAFDDQDIGGEDVVGDGIQDTINGVFIVFNGVKSAVFVPTLVPTDYVVNGHTFTVTLDADLKSVIVGGVADGTSIGVFTATGYNSIEYGNVGTDDYQIGDFGATVPSTAPVTFNVPVSVTDGDGDTAAGNLQVSAVPVSLDNQVATNIADPALTGNANANIIGGNQGNDTINGLAGNDTLFGGGDNDTLLGGDGNDILYGGNGLNTLTGGNNNDTFVIDAGATAPSEAAAIDLITDYAVGDIIDLTSLVNINGGVAANYIKYQTGTNFIMVDKDGLGTAYTFQAVAQLTNAFAGTVTIKYLDGTTTVSSGFTAVAPVVLDLNGDGASFVSTAAGVTFDFNGDGVRENTAWVAPSDGILVHDANGNGAVDGGSEITFSVNGSSDLEGLRQLYDSNHDGQLTADDAQFGSFGVWQDANGNGVSDPGEYHSLTEFGIVSIGLVANDNGYSAADGDVRVTGEATFTRADGSQGTVADAAFSTVQAEVEQKAAKAAIAQAPSNTGLTTALVAASLVAAVDTSLPQQAAAHVQADRGWTVVGDGQAASSLVAHLPVNEVRELVADHLSGAADLRPIESARPMSNTGSESIFHADLGGKAEIHHDLAPDAAHASPMLQPAMASPSIGGIMEMAAMPVLPAGLQVAGPIAQGGVADVRIAQVIADSLTGHGAGPDINGLLNNLPLGSNPATSTAANVQIMDMPTAGGGAGLMAMDLHAAGGQMFHTDLASFNVNQIFDVAMAAHDVAAAVGHA